MKQLSQGWVTLLVSVAILSLAVGMGAHQQAKPKNPYLGKLRHVVLFKFKDGTSEEDIKKLVTAFRALKGKIPAIVDFEWGVNNSPEGLNEGLTHCFLITFEDEKGRAEYLPHPAHREYVKLLRPHLDKVVVVDYVAQD